MSSTHQISILVADDHPVVLHGLVSLLAAQRDFRLVASCSDGLAAVEKIREFDPDLAVLDIAMPRLDGLDVLSMISSGHATKVIFLSAAATDEQILIAIARGAKGIMLKETVVDDLISCVREVATGGLWLPPGVVEGALERETGRRLQSDRISQSLTIREREVMKWVSEGLTNKEVAGRLGLSEGTVKIHLHNIYEKVGVPNRTALTALAIAYRNQLAM
jgi:DNA-binding NarL/FixJ family response regulator